MPSKFTGFDGKLAEFNEKYKVNFSFKKHESQSLHTDDIAPPLIDKMDSFTSPNLAYHNSLLSIYRDCVENLHMIDRKYETFDPGALVRDFDDLMDGYRDYCRSKGKPAPDALGGSITDRDIFTEMTSAINTMVSPNWVALTEKRYASGRLTLDTMQTYFLQFHDMDRTATLTEEQSNTINLYAAAMQNIVNSRGTFAWFNIFAWPRMFRENQTLKIAESVTNKFYSYMFSDIDEAKAPYKSIAERDIKKARSASYDRELQENKAKKLKEREQLQQRNEKEQQQNIEQDQQLPNIEESNLYRNQISLHALSEDNKNEEIIPMIEEENNPSQEKELDSSNMVV